MHRFVALAVILLNVAAWTHGFPWLHVNNGLPWPADKPSDSYSILTYNVGLLPHVPEYDARRLRTPEAVSNVDADVVCLQEVWYERDMRTILAVADEQQYPYVFSDLHNADGTLLAENPSTPLPCANAAFIGVFMPCMNVNCQITDNDELLIACAVTQCNMFQTISQECVSCIVLSGSTRSTEMCVSGPGSQVNVPGVMVMSKYPLRNVRIERFEDPNIVAFIQRAYITADIDDLGTIVCTHLTAGGRQYFENPQLGYTSSEQQNLAEGVKIVGDMSWKSSVLLLGDINSGPGIEWNDVEEELPDTYNYLTSQGYYPTHSLTYSACTYCMSNPLTDQQGSNVIDLVLAKRIKVRSLTMVLTENIAGETFPLSDHFGVLAKVRKCHFQRP